MNGAFILCSSFFGMQKNFAGYQKAKWIPTQPQNLRPTICPAYKMNGCKDGAEIEGMTNQ